MVSQSTELELRLIAKDEMSKAFKSASDEASGLGKSLGGVGQAAAGFLAAGAVQEGISKLTGAMNDSIKAARESDQAHAGLEATIKSTGAAAWTSVDKLEAHASAIEKNSLFEDEAASKGEAMLLTFTNVTDAVDGSSHVFSDATDILADMATKMGDDMSSEAIRLGKALNDPVKGISALTKVGVNFDAEQKKQIEGFVKGGETAKAQQVILAELTKEFGGQAKAASDAAGESEKQRDAMNQLSEDIGHKLIPIQEKWKAAQLAAITFVADTMIPALENLGESILPTLESAWSTLTEAIQPVTDAVTAFLEPIASSDEALQALAIVVGTALVVAFGALAVSAAAAAVGVLAAMAPAIAITAAIALLVIGIKELVDNWDALVEKFPILGEALDTLKSGFEDAKQWMIDAWPVIQDAVQQFIDWIKEDFGPVIDEWKTTIEDAITYIKDLFTEHWPEIKQIVIDVWDAIKAEIKLASDVIRDTLQIIIDLLHGDFGKAWDDAKKLVSDAWDGIVNVIKTQVNLVKDTVSGIGDIIKDALGDLGSLLVSAGEDVVNGLIKGIKSKIPDLGGVVGSLKDKISGLGHMLGANSPSKVMMAIGDDIMAGLNLGMQNGMPDIQSTMGGVANQIAQPMPSASPAAGGNVYVTVQGSILSERDVTRVVRDSIIAGGFRGLWSGGAA